MAKTPKVRAELPLTASRSTDVQVPQSKVPLSALLSDEAIANLFFDAQNGFGSRQLKVHIDMVTSHIYGLRDLCRSLDTLSPSQNDGGRPYERRGAAYLVAGAYGHNGPQEFYWDSFVRPALGRHWMKCCQSEEVMANFKQALADLGIDAEHVDMGTTSDSYIASHFPGSDALERYCQAKLSKALSGEVHQRIEGHKGR